MKDKQLKSLILFCFKCSCVHCVTIKLNSVDIYCKCGTVNMLIEDYLYKVSFLNKYFKEYKQVIAESTIFIITTKEITK